MSTRTVRSILAGIALIIVLMLALLPVSEAVRLSPALRDGGVVTLVWQWLSVLWNGELWRSSMPAQPPVHATSRATAPPPGPSGSTPTCGGDQGVCIDPNG